MAAQRPRRRHREWPTRPDGHDAIVGFDQIAGARQQKRRLAIGDDEHGLEAAHTADAAHAAETSFSTHQAEGEHVSEEEETGNVLAPSHHTHLSLGGVVNLGYYSKLADAMALLAWSLRHRWVVVVACAAILWMGWYLLTTSKLEFVVDDDMSEFEVVAEAPPGSSLERTAALVARMEEELRGIPEVVTLFSTVGVRGQAQANVGDISIYVGLKHLRERARSQEEIKQEARRRLTAFPGMRVSAQQLSLIGGGGFRQTPFNLILRGPDLNRLDQYARNVITDLSARPGFVDLDTAQAYRQPEVQVQIDRQKASDLGVRVDAVATTLRTMVGGEKVGFYRELGEQYDVRLRLAETFRSDTRALPTLFVPAADGRLVQLANVAALEGGMSPGQIERFAQERSITIISNLYGRVLADAYKDAYAAVARQQMPPEYGIVTIGRGKLLQEAMANFLIALYLSLAFIYIVLAAQFESFIHPVTIMVSMFLSIPFGLLTLTVLHRLGASASTLNIYSIMGLFLLMGVVKKNAILQVDYTNILRERGMPRFEAQMEADRARLRPILKWAGGKSRLVPLIVSRLPAQISTYYEPFVGGGAVFFALAADRRFKRAVLGDKTTLTDYTRA